ncbi:MAG: hypothetical protein ACJAYU_002167 [Bradymonadia bacterium]|jgi:uncharacterized protein (TIGR00266 family)
MTASQVIEQIQNGSITAQHYGFAGGLASWTRITEIPAFGPYFGGGPIPPPAPAPTAGTPSSDVIDYKIFGEDLQYVEITLDPSEACIAEAGAMMFMEPGIAMETVFGDGAKEPAGGAKQGGLMGALMTAGKRVITGESLFMTVFANQDPVARRNVSFAAPYPGTILPMDLKEVGGTLICQKDSFLCAARGVSIGIELQRKLGAGLFGGEGFILQKLTGDGLAFVHAGGVLVSRELQAGETLRVDTGCVVAFTPSVNYDIQLQKGIKSMVFGGEGLFLATLTGPGRVWMQSLPFSRFAGRIWSAAPQTGGQSVGEGSLLGGVGSLVMGNR